MRIRLSLLAILIAALLTARTAQAAPSAAVQTVYDRARLNFPNTLTFEARLQSSSEIRSVVLEYGADQLTCGTVIAKAFPQFTPGTSVDVSWTWDMRQSGSMPPGALIWWRWRVTDASGAESLTPQQTVTWLDSKHAWKLVSGGNINLYYYRGDQAFADRLHQSAVDARARLEQDTGVRTDKPIKIYVYGSYQDLGDAILFEPGWTGGQAFPTHNVVIIGISPDNVEWGIDAIAHELAHVLIGQQTFSCLGDMPTWLSEGLAMYAEGGLDGYSQQGLDQAIANDTLLSLRALSGGFSESSDKANLSYSQSYSVVNFLLTKYGKQSMTALLEALRDGETPDSALQRIYGFDTDGLEDAWRAWVKARPRISGPAPTATPPPTPVPTYVPISGAPQAAAPTPFPTPSATALPPDVPQMELAPNILVVLIAVCCIGLAFLVALAILIYFLTRKSGRSK